MGRKGSGRCEPACPVNLQLYLLSERRHVPGPGACMPADMPAGLPEVRACPCPSPTCTSPQVHVLFQARLKQRAYPMDKLAALIIQTAQAGQNALPMLECHQCPRSVHPHGHPPDVRLCALPHHAELDDPKNTLNPIGQIHRRDGHTRMNGRLRHGCSARSVARSRRAMVRHMVRS